MVKLHSVISKFLEFREEQRQELLCSHGCGKSLGDVVTVNLTYLEGNYLFFFSFIVKNEYNKFVKVETLPNIILSPLKQKLDLI